MKFQIALEYYIAKDGRQYLNFWDMQRAKDVHCEVVNGQLILHNEVPYGEVLTPITLSEFLNKVREAA